MGCLLGAISHNEYMVNIELLKSICTSFYNWCMKGIVSIIFICIFSNSVQATKKFETLASLPCSLNSVIQKVIPSVVNISITLTNHEIANLQLEKLFFSKVFVFFHKIAHQMNFIDDDNKRYFQSVGSGIIVDGKEGYIITNYHVIENANDIVVTLYDKSQFKATLIGSDSTTDIAVLKIKNNNLTEMIFANHESSKIGDFVVTIGNPSHLDYTVSFGVISGVNRTNLGIEKYENFIQTDVLINKGNSGGPLINMKGNLIGMNTAISKSNRFGFAISVDTINLIYKKIIKYKKLKRGNPGIFVKNIISAPNVTQFKKDLHGVLVYKVIKNSSADKHGLKVGDIITSIEGRVINNVLDVKKILPLYCVGESIQLNFLRGKNAKNVVLVIEELGALLHESSF